MRILGLPSPMRRAPLVTSAPPGVKTMDPISKNRGHASNRVPREYLVSWWCRYKHHTARKSIDASAMSCWICLFQRFRHAAWLGSLSIGLLLSSQFFTH